MRYIPVITLASVLTSDAPDFPSALPAYGPVAIASMAVIAVLFGVLVPRSIYNREVERGDRWEAVALEAMRQNGRLIPTAEVAVDVLRHIPSVPVAGADVGGVS